MSLSKKFGQRRVQKSFAGLKRRLRTPKAKHHSKRKEAENTLFTEWSSASDEDRRAFRLEADWLGDWVAYEKMIACLTAIPLAQHRIEEQLVTDELIAKECARPQCSTLCRAPRAHIKSEDRPTRIAALIEIRKCQRICEREARRLWRRLIDHLKAWLQSAERRWMNYNVVTFPAALVERLLFYGPTDLSSSFVPPEAEVLEYLNENCARSCLNVQTPFDNTPKTESFAHLVWLGDTSEADTLICWAALAWHAIEHNAPNRSVLAHLATSAFDKHPAPANDVIAEMLRLHRFSFLKAPSARLGVSDVGKTLSISREVFQGDLSAWSRVLQCLLDFADPKALCIVCNGCDGLRRLLSQQTAPCRNLTDELYIMGSILIVLGTMHDCLGVEALLCYQHADASLLSRLITQEIWSWVNLLFSRVNGSAASTEKLSYFPLAESIGLRLRVQTCACSLPTKLEAQLLDWIEVVGRCLVRADPRLNGLFVENLRRCEGVTQALRCEAAGLYERGNFRGAYMQASGALELDVDCWQARSLMGESYVRLMGRPVHGRRHRELIAEAVHLLLAA